MRFTTARAALTLAVVAIAGCLPAPPPQPERYDDFQLRQWSAMAVIAFDRGELDTASTLLRRALDRALFINSAIGCADAEYNLAACEVELGQYATAQLLLETALYDALRARSDAEDIRLLRARVDYLEGKLAEAAQEAYELQTSSRSSAVRAQAALLRGQVLCDAGDVAGAHSQLQAADQMVAAMGKTTSPAIWAAAARLRASLARRQGDFSSAAAGFDEEAAEARDAHRYREMARALARAGEAYQAGHDARAADRFFLAARSAIAQHNTADARNWIRAGLASGKASQDDAALKRLESLEQQFSEADAP